MAIKLKEKGLILSEEYIFGAYDEDGDLFSMLEYKIEDCWCAYAPTIFQVLKWLREETKINVNMRLYKENGWYYTIQNYKWEPLYSQLTNTDELYPSYEEAALVGIEYVINNLI